MTAAQAREWIAHSPPDPGPIAPGLMGWRDNFDDFFCAVCVGRIIARGITTGAMRNWRPVWSDSSQAPADYGKQLSPGRCVCCGKE